VLEHGLGTLGIGLRLIADGLEAADAVLDAGSSRSATPASMAS
jgi:hypothetical protein